MIPVKTPADVEAEMLCSVSTALDDHAGRRAGEKARTFPPPPSTPVDRLSS